MKNKSGILDEISFKLNEIILLAKKYEEKVKADRKQLSDFDKFDQAALHLIERIDIIGEQDNKNTSNGLKINEKEALDFLGLWIKMRKNRRKVKGQLLVENNRVRVLLDSLKSLDDTLKKEPYATNANYNIPSLEMNMIIAKGLVPFKNENNRNIGNEALTKKEGVYFSKTKKETVYHLTRKNRNWILLKKSKGSYENLIEAKKLSKIIQFIIEKNIKVYVEPEYIATFNNLVKVKKGQESI